MNKILACTVLAMTLSTTAMAQAPGKNSVYVAAGIATVPRYDGADSYRLIPLASGRATWEQRYIAIEGPSLRANIVNDPSYEFGPIIGFVGGRSGDLGSVAVKSLGTIKAAAELGAFAGYKIKLSPSSRLRFGVEASHDVTGIHNGWQGKANVGYSLTASKRIRLSATASAGFADARYATTYFGITPAGSLASGLAVYTPKGGLKDVGLGLMGTYSFSRRWSLTALGNYRRLQGDFAKSPIVAREGSPNQVYAGLGLGYSF